MVEPAFKMERVLYRRSEFNYCGYRRLGITLDSKRNQLHHALVHSAGMACLDIETGQVVSSTPLSGTSGAKDCSFSPPENICCCAVGRSIMCFDPRQSRVIMEVHAIDSAISAISCSQDGRYVAYSSSDSSVGLFSLRMSCVVRAGLFHTSCVNSCYFQEDNSGFWTAVSKRKARNTRFVRKFTDSQGSDRMVSKFKAETGTSQMNFKDHADPISVCKPARDGSIIATGAADHVVWNYSIG
jgi:WD40 repeat protein